MSELFMKRLFLCITPVTKPKYIFRPQKVDLMLDRVNQAKKEKQDIIFPASMLLREGHSDGRGGISQHSLQCTAEHYLPIPRDSSLP
jgi:hypothetical protein